MEFKKILCPVDFSEVSKGSLKRAANMARQHEADLLVLHVVHDSPWMFPPVPTMPVNTASFQADMQEAARTTLAEMVDEIVPDSLPSETMVASGDAGPQISTIAEENGVDLVVIASRDKNTLDRLIFGSVAEKVIRTSPCAVLVLKN